MVKDHRDKCISLRNIFVYLYVLIFICNYYETIVGMLRVVLVCRYYLNLAYVSLRGYFLPDSLPRIIQPNDLFCDCRKNKSFRPRDKGKKGLKNLQSVKTLAGRTQSYSTALCNKARKQPLTVSAQFQLSLHSLMETLNQANPFFIRCIKSNSEKVDSTFLNLHQKKC